MKHIFQKMILLMIILCGVPSLQADCSSLNYPYPGCIVNTSRPTITGVICCDTTIEGKVNQINKVVVCRIYIDNTLLGTEPTNKEGVFVYTIPQNKALSQGEHTVFVTSLDGTIELGPITFTVDLTIPLAPVISSPTNGSTLAAGTIIIQGTAQANSTLFIFLDGSTYADNAYANDQGAWTMDYQLSSGSHTIQAQQQSIAGNLGPLSNNVTFYCTP